MPVCVVRGLRDELMLMLLMMMMLLMLLWLVLQPAPAVPAPAPTPALAAAPTVVSARLRCGVVSCGGVVCARSLWVRLCLGREVPSS